MKNKTNVTICINSKGGRGGIENIQPSVQDRIYDEKGIMTSITTTYQPLVLQRIKNDK